MAETRCFAKGKEGFLKKLFGAAVISLGLSVFAGTKAMAAEAWERESGLEYIRAGGITPGALGDGFWVVTEIRDPNYESYEATYDAKGNIIKRIEYSGAEETVSGIREYDTKGYIVKYTSYNSDGTLNFIYEYENEYDKNGNLSRNIRCEDGVEITGYEYEYDSKGNRIKEIFIYSYGTMSYVTMDCEYDAKGYRSKETHYYWDGTPCTILEFDYDINGNCTELREGACTHKYKYDAYGNLIQSITYDSNGDVIRIYDWVYDEKGNETEGTITKGEKNDSDGIRGLEGINRKCEYEYDETGRNVTQKITYYDANGTKMRYFEVKWSWFDSVDEKPVSNDEKLTDIISELPDDGAVTVDYSDNSEVSADVFTAIAGTKKEVTFTSEGISWEFSGSDIDASAAKKIDLSTTITKINQQDPNTAGAIENLLGKESNALVLKFADNGKLPGKATIRVSADEALKQYLGTTGLDVYYWDSENNALVPIASSVSINENNEIVFEIDHCSYYVVKGRETTKEDKHIPEDANKDVPAGYEMLFRLYNPNSGEHFYTTSKREGNKLIDLGWNYEGEGWTAPITGTPVYRLYNENAGDHHYTTSKKERDKLISAGWTDEGIGWYSESKETGKPLYRLYNPNATGAGSHHYTTSTRERDKLVQQGWNDEGIAWYGLNK